jgi:gluconolactonase
MSVLDVADDGTLTGKREFATCDDGVFDGFRLDTAGRVWTSAADGVHCYDPDGTPLGKVLVPETVANVTWGWPKRNRLYICATTSLYAILLAVNGAKTM